MWRQTIRTGNYEADKQMVETARSHATAQGLVLQVRPIPNGGFEVEAVPPGSPYVQQQPAPYAPAPPVGAMQLAAPAAAQALTADHCQACRRRAPTKHVTFMQNVGCIVIRFPKTTRGYLCRLCISSFFWRYTLITFFFGWWGVISFFYSLVSIPNNIATFLGARSLPVDFDTKPSPAPASGG
jgi:hypothetical protein